MNNFVPAGLPTPEDDNKPVRMNPGSVEPARDRESARPLATSATSIDAHREGPPVTTMNSETPVSAPLTNAPTEQTDVHLTEMHSSTASRAGDYISDNHNIGQPSPVSTSRPRLSAYELEATVVSKTVANENFTAYQPGGASRQSLGRSRDFRDSALRRATTAPRPPRWGTATTPATAFYHPNISDANRGRSTNEASGSDPFLGTGRPMRSFPSSPVPVTSVKTIETPSPSIERLRSSRLDGTPGVMDLHDSQEEILSLLNKLQSAHISHTNNEVDSALTRCQDDLRARSKDKAIGTAEANILDREAARIGRAGGTPTRPAQDTEDAALLWRLRQEMTRLVEDARAALDAAAEAKSQAASSSTPRETKGYIPYRVGDDSRVAELRSEAQELRKQVDQLHAEKEKACKEREEARKENSDLLRTVDRLTEEVKGYRREYNTRWGRDWNVGSRRSE